MRHLLALALLLIAAAQPALAERKDSTPLVKAPPTVEPCLAACETEFTFCEGQPQATMMICPESRSVCIIRCDPAVLSSSTLKALRRSPEELRHKPASPQTSVEQCRQGCQDRRMVCLKDNAKEACEPAGEFCYSRCDKQFGASGAVRP